MTYGTVEIEMTKTRHYTVEIICTLCDDIKLLFKSYYTIRLTEKHIITNELI